MKYRLDSNDEFSEPHFRNNCQRLLNLHELPEQYLTCVEELKEFLQSYQREGSGWQLKEVKLILCLQLVNLSHKVKKICEWNTGVILNIKYVDLTGSLGIFVLNILSVIK